MSRFTHLIFDLDGTLTDNTKGIQNSLKYALKKIQINNFREEFLEQFIGPPLQWGFRNLFGMNERNTQLAVEYFREYFGEKGLYENEPYPGIHELLEDLYFDGVKMYIATSKLEKYALQIMEYFEFDKYIIQLKGADYGGNKATKTEIISDLISLYKINPSEKIAMIGDTVFDIEGGNQNGLTTIAVTYGFGKKEDLHNSAPDYVAESVDELYSILNS